MHKGNPVLDILIQGQWCIDGPSIYICLMCPVSPVVISTKKKRTSRLGRLLALSLEILYAIVVVKYLFTFARPLGYCLITCKVRFTTPPSSHLIYFILLFYFLFINNKQTLKLLIFYQRAQPKYLLVKQRKNK